MDLIRFTFIKACLDLLFSVCLKSIDDFEFLLQCSVQKSTFLGYLRAMETPATDTADKFHRGLMYCLIEIFSHAVSQHTKTANIFPLHYNKSN